MCLWKLNYFGTKVTKPRGYLCQCNSDRTEITHFLTIYDCTVLNAFFTLYI